MTLEGHLAINRELVFLLPPDRKLEIGCSKGESGPGGGLIAELVEDWIFPASKLWVAYSTSGQIPHSSTTTAVCQTPAVVSAAFDLLVSLCTGCPGNLCQLGTMLADMFYTRETEAVSEWEFLPPVGPRPSQGFVGLKNAGATCCMNSVLQHYILEGIKTGVLKYESACTDTAEDFSGEDRLEDENSKEDGNRGDYNLTILKQV